MSFYRTPITGQTDASGNAAISIGPLQGYQFFLGYVTAQVKGNDLTGLYQLQDLAGAPIASANGRPAVLGPLYLAPGDQAILAISGAPPSSTIQGYLVGDRQANPADLVALPAPNTAPNPIIGITDIVSLAKANLTTGFTALSSALSDAYIMGWNLWVTNGAAAAQIAVAIEGDQSTTVVAIGSLMALANGISSLSESLAFPFLVAKLLPSDTTFHVGLSAEANYTLNTRGQVYLGN